jgi:nucleoside-diphosphate-sugar epimerase
MRILITGATGFIGSALCMKLMQTHHFVRAAVRSGKGENCLKDIEYFETGEIGAETNWSKALDGMEAVVHLAGKSGCPNDKSLHSLPNFQSVNVRGTEHLASSAAKMGIKKFIYVSTVKVHGEETKAPFTENSVCSPRDSYGVSKWEAELALQSISAKTGMNVVVLRSPMVYGASSKSNFVRLISLVRSGIPLPFASISNKRSMIYVGNLVDAILHCVEKKEGGSQTFLVSDGEDISTPDLMRLIALNLNTKVRVISFPERLLKATAKICRRDEEMRRLTGSLQVDSSKIKSILGWKPPFTLQEGMAQSIRGLMKSKY